MQQTDDSRMWKYLELPQEFQRRAGEIDLTAKQHARIIERLAKHLARQRPKAPEEFERVEYLKEFAVKSAVLNDQVINLLAYLRDRINEMYADYEAFRDGARLSRVIRDQGERLDQITNERDELENELNELKRKLRGAHPATA